MLKILEGQDITKLPFRVGAIVNSAHPTLKPGGGVCGAIHRAAGRELARECERVMLNLEPHTGSDELERGWAVVTDAYELRAHHVVHVLAPNIGSGDPCDFDIEGLRSCYASALTMAEAVGAKSVAFPLLGAGVYGWPKDEALRIAKEELEKSVMETNLCIYP